MGWLRRTVSVLVLLALSFTLLGCHTAEGAGKDIESAGEEIQEEAREDL